MIIFLVRLYSVNVFLHKPSIDSPNSQRRECFARHALDPHWEHPDLCCPGLFTLKTVIYIPFYISLFSQPLHIVHVLPPWCPVPLHKPNYSDKSLAFSCNGTIFLSVPI